MARGARATTNAAAVYSRWELRTRHLPRGRGGGGGGGVVTTLTNPVLARAGLPSRNGWRHISIKTGVNNLRVAQQGARPVLLCYLCWRHPGVAETKPTSLLSIFISNGRSPPARGARVWQRPGGIREDCTQKPFSARLDKKWLKQTRLQNFIKPRPPDKVSRQEHVMMSYRSVNDRCQTSFFCRS